VPAKRRRPTLDRPAHRERKRCEHRNQQLQSTPCPLRDPEAGEKQKRTKATGRVSRPMRVICRERFLSLPAREPPSRHDSPPNHNCLPRGWRVTRLYVIVDQACVARRSVETFPRFQRRPHKHRADRETNDCQPICRGSSWPHLRWLALVIIVNLVPMDAVPVATGERDRNLKRFFLFLLVDAQRSL